MEGASESMLNTTDDDNRFSAGVKVMDHMVDQAGGYASVGHMIKDLHNIIDAKRKTLFTNSDVDAIISWILKTFLSAMHGKYPTSVVTNGDKTMLKEIKAEISGSNTSLRLNCMRRLTSSGCMEMYGDKDVCKTLKLYEYMRQIDRAMERLRHTEMKDDFENLNEHHILVTHLELLEKHATELYTRGIFQLVHDKIEEKAKLSICKFVDGVESQTYTFRKFDGGNKTWNVSYNPMLSMLQCSCKLFEAAGIPYRHTLGVMKAQNMRRIPRTLLMTRWIINAKKDFNNKQGIQLVTDEFMYDYRLGSLSARCSKMCYFASLTTDGHQKAKLAIDYLYRNAVTNTIFKYRNGRICPTTA
ncbi:hypothetical protein JRO89_XS12G0166000 [Xanthoceras sorbifolium]|uniref:SWIM-type domain-containing protein n=1 Tax=Xanthoceras sorbifolium TaxID=99658 RepID=A0ABQ8HCV8_9ROSI|nr:hypothetical protein JRO89_XS12G0166000 [Xanthoceras sorbifolium]